MSDTNNPNCFKLISPHPRIRRLAKSLIFLFIFFILALAFIPWQQTAEGSGKVVALSPNEREQNISAPVEGRLGKWYVHDGSYVKAGDPIVELLDNDPDLLKRLQIEKKAIQLRLDAVQRAAKTALINVERQKKLFNEGISSRRKFEQAQFEFISYQNEIAKAQVEMTKINVRIARQETQLVKAPLDGTIIRRMAGQESVLVKQGDILAVLVPDTKSRAVALWLDGNDIPLIKQDQPVRLQFEGWPAIQFSGWPSVAVGTFGGKVALIDPTDNGRGQFRILVVPDNPEKWPSKEYLRQGVRANGWVLLDRVQLWFELWRRFNGFPPTVTPPEPQLMQASQ
ncbi:MAG: HlyD family efflux transporter periplasmic adaptor subunit [Pseudomonadota bacterium]